MSQKNARQFLGQVTVNAKLFAKYQTLIHEKTGIWLASSKTALLCGRLSRRLRVLQLETLDEYYDLVTRPDQHDELVLMIDAITTNETHFFREPKHFEFLAQRLFPRWHSEAAERVRPRKLRVWSAGCSSGEEPYSLAMILLKYFPPEAGWDLEIVATDISTQVLAKARAGIYPIERAKDIPKDLLQTHMFEGVGEQSGKMKIGREAKQIVQFSRLNLHDERLAIGGSFDAIFCRNVLIYFDGDSKKLIVNGLINHLSPNGLLFVGHSENLAGVTGRVKSLAPTIYGRVGEDGRLLSDFRNDGQRPATIDGHFAN